MAIPSQLWLMWKKVLDLISTWGGNLPGWDIRARKKLLEEGIGQPISVCCQDTYSRESQKVRTANCDIHIKNSVALRIKIGRISIVSWKLLFFDHTVRTPPMTMQMYFSKK